MPVAMRPQARLLREPRLQRACQGEKTVAEICNPVAITQVVGQTRSLRQLRAQGFDRIG
jgi:hypothetical protein